MPVSLSSADARCRRAAAAYGVAIGIAALAATVPLLSRLDNSETSKWTTFLILAAGAAASHTYTVRTARDTAFHTSWVFLIPSALLLPPELVALLGVVMHVPEWLKERYAWYIQSFNICNYTLGNLATWGAAALLLRADGLDSRRPPPLGARRSRSLRGRRRSEPHRPCTDGQPRPRPLAAGGRRLLLREPLDRLHPRDARPRRRRVLGPEPVADPVRGRAAAADPPLARDPAAAGRGASRLRRPVSTTPATSPR